MKQLVCEMCGGTELVKDGGVFVCQTCGCKYTVEEAKKMMVEGTVEVHGTVKVDRTSEIANILKNADATYEDGNYKEAFDLYSQVISSEPENAHAILYRAMASAWQSSVKDCKIGEINRASERAIKIKHEQCGDTAEFFDFASKALSDIAPILNAIEGMYIRYHNKAMPVNITITGALATAGLAEQVKTTMRNGVLNCCTVAHNLINYIVLVTEDYSESDKKFWGIMELYPKNCITYRKNANLESDSADQKLINTIAELKEKSKSDAKAKKIAQINEYWAEHLEEKSQKENELEKLNNSIAKIECQIKDIPEKNQIDDYNNQIASLNDEKKNLGLFKIKEKKLLQERIDSIEKMKAEVQEKIDKLSAYYNYKMNPLKKQANSILTALGREPQY